MPSWPTWHPRTYALLAERDRLQAALDAWHQAPPRPHRRHASLPSHVSKTSATWCPARKGPGQHRQRGRRTGQASRPATGGAHTERPLCPRTPPTPAGARCTTRCTAPTRLQKTRAAKDRQKSGYNPVRGKQVIEYARHVLDRTAPLRKGLARGLHRLRASKTASWWSRCRTAAAPSWQDNAAACWLPRRCQIAHLGFAAAPRPAPGHAASTAARPIGADRRSRRQRPGGRSRAVHHPRSGRLGGGGRRRGQGAGLQQLAGHSARHADRSV